MFRIDDDLTINLTRGDTAIFAVNAVDEKGETYLFKKDDVIRMKVTEKKACEKVVLEKVIVCEEDTEQVEIYINEDDSKIGDIISKPTDYWYEVELNPFTNPTTIIGYDEDGAKIFKLYPEADSLESTEITPEDIPLVDSELDLASDRPIQNKAVSEAFINFKKEIEYMEQVFKNELLDEINSLKSIVHSNKNQTDDEFYIFMRRLDDIEEKINQ